MSSSDDVVRTLYAAFGRGDLPAVLAALADDVDWRCSAPPSVPFAGRWPGRAGAERFFTTLLSSVRLDAFEPRTFLTQADTVVVLGRDRGVALRTGRSYEAEWVHVWTVRSGRVAGFHEFLESTIGAAFAES